MMGKTQPLIAIAHFNHLEQHRVVNSPRSPEVCSREGVGPLELLYLRPEGCSQPNLSDELQQLHYGLYKRKRILQMVKDTRKQLVEVYGRLQAKTTCL
jgi:hypothetical protein